LTHTSANPSSSAWRAARTIASGPATRPYCGRWEPILMPRVRRASLGAVGADRRLRADLGHVLDGVVGAVVAGDRRAEVRVHALGALVPGDDPHVQQVLRLLQQLAADGVALRLGRAVIGPER